MTIITEYPLWFTPLCILLGIIYAGSLYRKDKRFEEVNAKVKWILLFFRFTLISFLGFLLLGPFVKTIFTEIEKPAIIIAQDNSESILIGADSAYFKGRYKEDFQELCKALGSKYEVKQYSFGSRVTDGITYTYDEKQTDLSELFNELFTIYSNRNVGAVILASDGLYNKGDNPLLNADISKLGAPVYAIALGDTCVRKDLLIKKIGYNKLAYLGNEFPIEVGLDAHRCKGLSTELTIVKDGKTISSKIIPINNNSFFTNIPLHLTADKTGMQHYKVKLSHVENEVSYTNNIKDIYIDVLDSRQKILVLARAPHPDVGALHQSIAVNDNYQVDEVMAEELSHFFKDGFDKLKSYNLIIMHQLPSRDFKVTELLSKIMQFNVPVLMVMGSQSDIAAVNSMHLGVQINGSNDKFNEAQAVVNDKFSLFYLEANSIQIISQLPPLPASFGQYNVSMSSNILFYQKIGMVVTGYPLLVFTDQDGTKKGLLTGEGIWKWRLHSYLISGGHEVFNDLISKVIQYLAVKSDQSHLRVISKNNYLENEPVLFDAEVYNDSYELINKPEINLTIINSDNQLFPFTFSPASTSYRLDAGMFPVGEYSYRATVTVGTKVYIDKGQFSISPVQVESTNTIADHQLMYNLAIKNGGKMFYPQALAKLKDEIEMREDIKPISYSEKHLKELIHLKWVFFLLLALVSAEWFLRKRSGAY